MAIIYPDLEQIKGLTVQPEEGEWYLLNFLKDNLDDSFEVYFNPFLNGDRPDFIIMREGYGVMIIEVKDWKLQHYHLDEKRRWRLNLNGSFIKSPIDQVLQYKENLYNLHIEDLLEYKIKNSKYWAIVCCAVYFHNETENSLDGFLKTPYKDDRKYLDFLRHNIELIGRNNLNRDYFNTMLKKRYLDGDFVSMYFSNDLYHSFKRYLQPTIHLLEDGQKINYSQKQKELIVSEARLQRVKGVVGSGKTTVLAERAVNAHLRTGRRVLILTFNITLKNYIHDKISKVRQPFSWDNFYITNYHNFITTELNNLGIPVIVPDDFSEWSEELKSSFWEKSYHSNIKLFEDKKSEIHRYPVILIDEIQDYRREWMDIVKNYFLEPGGEYVLYGDEKQNIYANELENKDIRTNVVGAPSVLSDCFRSEKRIREIAVSFQRSKFSTKYNIDDFNVANNNQLALDFEKSGQISYIYVPVHEDIDTIYKLIREIILQLDEHPNNVAVLGFTFKLLRKLESYYRYMTNEKTNAMFETSEVWYKLMIDLNKNNSIVTEGLNLFGWNRKEEDKHIQLAIALTLKALIRDFNEDAFGRRFAAILEKNKVNAERFQKWYLKPEFDDFWQQSELKNFKEKIRQVRENKKVNFWFNRGTVKFSTIHSFKGWEANTLFLLLEPRYNSGDFQLSFDELIYTGLTRSRLNLIVLNHGNNDDHENLKRIFSFDDTK